MKCVALQSSSLKVYRGDGDIMGLVVTGFKDIYIVMTLMFVSGLDNGEWVKEGDG